ncbi:MAG: hypothetical protein ABFS10_10725 [Bacteroidota bacterium]
MRLKILFSTVSIIALSVFSFSQSTDTEFQPAGKAFIKVFTNYHSTWTDGEANKVFEIQRAYFGYKYQLSEHFSGKLTLDVGDPSFGDLEMTAYLKHAYAQYKKRRLTARLGMIGLTQFKMQEVMWGGRYLYKSFMDEHKFGPSADLGAYVAYDIHEKLSVDLTVANGEGYKKLESDTVLKYSAGVTLLPFRGLDLRASYDHMGTDSAQQTLALYMGYRNEKLALGAEYNQQLNHKKIAGHELTGISLYGSYLLKKLRLFGRYDMLSSPSLRTDTDPWNYAKDGQLIIAGIEFRPVKGLVVTPNYQGWIPADAGGISHSAYLSLEIKF